ncbi:MAG: rhomboid family intramembrane serine protease, partial [Defluviitaleaceae bacterium]|nr:rhomboid family intramembrane serine protease [Defluviitaleaceae bacterium]
MDNFYEKIFETMISNGYLPAKGMEVYKGDALMPFMLAHKGAWYIFIVINMDKISMQEFKLANLTYSSYYGGIKGNRNHVYIVNLLVTNEENIMISSFIENLEIFEPAQLNNLFWHLPLNLRTLVQNKTHPTEVLNITNLINQALGLEKATIVQKLPNLKTPHLTLIIIALNIAFFVFVFMNGGITTENLVRFGAIHPIYIREEGEVFRLLTATFLHGGIFHLGANMPLLYAFGKRIESLFGATTFAIIYTASGLSGSIFSLFLSNSIAVGASGAISGLLGCML